MPHLIDAVIKLIGLGMTFVLVGGLSVLVLVLLVITVQGRDINAKF